MHRTCVSRSSWLAAAALLISACGGGGGGSATGDTSAAAITDGATDVGLLTKPTIYVPQFLTPDSIDNVTVSLRQLDGTPVPGYVSAYTLPSSMLTLTPFSPLQPHTTYELRIDGASTADGTLVQHTVSFTTVDNPMKELHKFETTNGVTSGLLHYQFDQNGRYSNILHYADAGDDGLWDTADDILDGYTDVTSTASTVSLITRDAPGNDGVPYTADDPRSGALRFTYDADNHLLQYMVATDPGNDNTWLTSDDQLDSLISYSYDERNHLVQQVDYADPGADGLWHTTDDVPSGYQQFTYNDAQRLDQYFQIDGPGTDGVWFSGSEHASMVTGFMYSGGDLSRSIYSNNAGNDGQWLTSDDNLSYSSYEYNADRILTHVIDWSSAGSDGVWFNADDTPAAWKENKVDDNGRVFRSVTYQGAGADNTWFTTDDLASSMSEWYYNDDGSTAQQRDYSGSGDGLSLTGYTTYSYGTDGLLSETVVYVGEGSDATWFTADDQVGSRTTYW